MRPAEVQEFGAAAAGAVAIVMFVMETVVASYAMEVVTGIATIATEAKVAGYATGQARTIIMVHG